VSERRSVIRTDRMCRAARCGNTIVKPDQRTATMITDGLQTPGNLDQVSCPAWREEIEPEYSGMPARAAPRRPTQQRWQRLAVALFAQDVGPEELVRVVRGSVR
jgi:hypothetical protein